METTQKLDTPLDDLINKSSNDKGEQKGKPKRSSYGKDRGNKNNFNNNNNNYNNNNNTNNNNNYNNQSNNDGNSGNNRRPRVSPYDSKSGNGRRRDNRGGNDRGGNNNTNNGGGNAYVPQQYQQFPSYPMQGSMPSMSGMPVSHTSAGPSLMRKVIKVSAKSNVKSVAGAISHTTRAGESPTIVATGSESVNQAIKALAIARGYLQDNKLDISCQPVFRNQEKGALSFVLTKSQLRPKKQEDETQELRVAKNSDANSVAGSIANKVRSGERVVILSIGAGSVNQTVRAVALARRFLEGDGIDVCFRPEFIHITLDDGERSAIKFVILSQQI